MDRFDPLNIILSSNDFKSKNNSIKSDFKNEEKEKLLYKYGLLFRIYRNIHRSKYFFLLDRELFSISLYRIAEELGRTDFLK